MHDRTSSGSPAAQLAARPPLRLGALLVDPARRHVAGPGGAATLEPRVMQVLLRLADADGAVVTRAALIEDCWQGRFVGDDAVNRTISEVRRVARGPGAGSFAVETIPKTGWRLTGSRQSSSPDADITPPATAPTGPVVRRHVLALAAGTGLAATAGGFWLARPTREQAQAAELLVRAEIMLRNDMPDAAREAVGLLEQADRLDPDNAAILGKLALAWRDQSEYADPAEIAPAVANTERYARRALALDPRQADAIGALATLAPFNGDWLAARRRYLDALARSPGNLAVTAALALLAMSTGEVREQLRLNTWLVERQPLSPTYQYRRVYGLWASGRAAEADQAIDRARKLWPQHPGIWLARFLTLAFGGQPRAAAALLDEEVRAGRMGGGFLRRFNLALRALETGAAADIDAAATEARRGSSQGEGASVNAVLILSALGRLDDAFDVARAYLLNRGPLVVDQTRKPGAPSVPDQRRRKTMMLFLPPTASLRADPRFIDLCRDMGLVDYWRQAGTRPDFLGSRPLPS